MEKSLTIGIWITTVRAGAPTEFEKERTCDFAPHAPILDFLVVQVSNLASFT